MQQLQLVQLILPPLPELYMRFGNQLNGQLLMIQMVV